MGIYQIATLIFTVCVALAEFSCDPRDFGNGGTVCVCNAKHCDYVEPVTKVNSPQVLIYTSNLEGLRLYKTMGTFNNSTDDGFDIGITRDQTYQKIQGFGGAFTDAAGININNLTDDAKEHLLRSYFSKEGIQYNLCRVPIGGTDFSTSAYSYDDGDPDPELKNFALNQADKDYKIPYINKAQNLAGEDLKFFASAWTAPKWMKTNEKYVGGTIKPEMYQAWANYYVKFFDMYKKHGIKFWGVTTGNEPSLAKFPLVTMVKLNSVGWTSSTVATWVANNLGPTLRKHYKDINIMALDDQRFYVPWFIDMMFKNEVAKGYVNGTALHFYWDKLFPPHLLSQLHDKYPDKFILATEGCEGSLFWTRGVRLGSWSRGEDYARDIIEDLQNWVIGWVDWNIALNTAGGPTYIDNIVDSPIIVNASANEFYKQPTFYALGHFSKFLPRNSIRIKTSKTSKVSTVAFMRPDNGVAIIILNKKSYAQNITISDANTGAITLNISANSITSMVYW